MRLERDLEALRGGRQPGAKRLQVRLLARPGVEEALGPLLTRKRTQPCELAGRERVPCERLDVAQRPQVLEVDPYAPPARHRDQGAVGGVGEIELQLGMSREAGLAMRPVGELERVRRGAGIAG